MSLCIELSTKNFKEASKINGSNEFKFIIDEEKIHCHKFVAAFISPNISKMLISDPTLNSFNFNEYLYRSNKQSTSQQIISTIIKKMINGEKIEISENELQEISHDLDTISKITEKEYLNTKIYYYIVLIESLGNEEIKQQFYSRIFSCISANKNSNHEIESKIKKLLSFEKILNIQKSIHKNFNSDESLSVFTKDYLGEEYSKFVDNIASNFHIIDESLIIKLNSSLFEELLMSKSLKIKDEDTFLNTLLKRRSLILQNHGNEDDFFLHHVHFEFLSEEGMKKFLDEISFAEINEQIWESMKRRLVLPTQNSQNASDTKGNAKDFLYNGSSDFDGILKHLTDISGGNIQANKTIEIKCSSNFCGSLEKIVDFNCTDGFVHVHSSNGSVQFDFKERKLQINSYQIKSSYRSGENYLKSWKIEISEDGNKWEQVDMQSDVEEIVGKNIIKQFPISMTKPFRFIRIVDRNNNYFAFSKIEFYGKLYE